MPLTLIKQPELNTNNTCKQIQQDINMSKQYHSDKDFTVPNSKPHQPDQLAPFSKPTIYMYI